MNHNHDQIVIKICKLINKATDPYQLLDGCNGCTSGDELDLYKVAKELEVALDPYHEKHEKQYQSLMEEIEAKLPAVTGFDGIDDIVPIRMQTANEAWYLIGFLFGVRSKGAMIEEIRTRALSALDRQTRILEIREQRVES